MHILCHDFRVKKWEKAMKIKGSATLTRRDDLSFF